MKVFGDYAAYYDLFYGDKDYAAECRYFTGLLTRAQPTAVRLLELGTGTGRHAVVLAQQGYALEGVDLSPGMLERARQVCGDAVPLHCGDVRDIRLGKSFDAVFSFFHVASYQAGEGDLRRFLDTARAHLLPGGTFVFDFWYAPAVIHLRPVRRSRTVQGEGVEIRRDAVPRHLPEQHVVEVAYRFTLRDRHSGEREKFGEVHRMRYYALPEIDLALNGSGFRRLQAEEWLTGHVLDDSTWSACVLAQAV